MSRPTHTLPDWHLIRALLLNDLDSYPDGLCPAKPSIDLHTYLLTQQRWVIGQCALGPDGIPISSAILSLTMDGLDWASLLEDADALTNALSTLEKAGIRPSTTLLRELLLAHQRDQFKPNRDEFKDLVVNGPITVIPSPPPRPKKK